MTKLQLEYWELAFKVAAYLGGAVLFVIKIITDNREHQLKKVEINVKKEALKASRFNYLEKLSTDFNKQENKPALFILDDFGVEGVHTSNLAFVLRNHKEAGIDKETEMKIRASFDSLLESCLLILYHYEQGMISEKEIAFFTYYLNKVKNSPAVLNYIKVYYLNRGLDKLFALI